MLLVGAGLLLRSFARMQTADLGFNAENVLSVRLSLPEKNYQTDEQRALFNQRLLERVALLPGVVRADLASGSPLDTNWETNYHVPGTPAAPPGQTPLAEMNVVSDGYFQTLGIPLLRGRTFGPGDTPKAPAAVIIDQAFAERVFPGADPVGKKINVGGEDDKAGIVVGVVPTLKVYGYAMEPKLCRHISRPGRNVPDTYMLLVRAVATWPHSLPPCAAPCRRSTSTSPSGT